MNFQIGQCDKRRIKMKKIRWYIDTDEDCFEIEDDANQAEIEDEVKYYITHSTNWDYEIEED